MSCHHLSLFCTSFSASVSIHCTNIPQHLSPLAISPGSVPKPGLRPDMSVHLFGSDPTRKDIGRKIWFSPIPHISQLNNWPSFSGQQWGRCADAGQSAKVSADCTNALCKAKGQFSVWADIWPYSEVRFIQIIHSNHKLNHHPEQPSTATHSPVIHQNSHCNNIQSLYSLELCSYCL